MNAIRLTTFGLILISSIVLRPVVFADQYTIGGNAAGSQNSLNVDLQQSTNVQQNNQGSFSNDINAGANTGGNSVSGGNGGSITTGDASVNVNVDNQFNSNQANVDQCCPTPTPTRFDPGKPTPTPSGKTPTSTPTPTLSDGGNGKENNGGNGGGGGVGGAGQVIGLSAASGEGTLETILTTSGIVWLLAGAYLTRKNHLAI